METMEKIKVEDLSVGDWVRVRMCKCDYDDHDTLYAKVLSIVGNSVGVCYDNSGIVMRAFVDDLQPIPITAEVLENNGFEQNSNCLDYRFIIGNIYCLISKGIKCWYVNVYDISDSPHTPIFKAHIIHIHEFQRVLRLAKVGKGIVL